MTDPTVPTRPDRPQLDHDLAADVVARMLELADRVRPEVAEGEVGGLSLFLADANLLGRVVAGGWDRADLAELAGRLSAVVRGHPVDELRARVDALSQQVIKHFETCPYPGAAEAAARLDDDDGRLAGLPALDADRQPTATPEEFLALVRAAVVVQVTADGNLDELLPSEIMDNVESLMARRGVAWCDVEMGAIPSREGQTNAQLAVTAAGVLLARLGDD